MAARKNTCIHSPAGFLALLFFPVACRSSSPPAPAHFGRCQKGGELERGCSVWVGEEPVSGPSVPSQLRALSSSRVVEITSESPGQPASVLRTKHAPNSRHKSQPSPVPSPLPCISTGGLVGWTRSDVHPPRLPLLPVPFGIWSTRIFRTRSGCPA